MNSLKINLNLETDRPEEENQKRTLIKSVAFEEVVSYRSTFISYWAVPLFIAFISLLAVIGWFVKIPEKKALECTFSWNKEKSVYESPIDNFYAGEIHIADDHPPVIQLSNGRVSGGYEANKVIADIGKTEGEQFKANVEIIVLNERFLVKLFEDLLVNLRIHKVAD